MVIQMKLIGISILLLIIPMMIGIEEVYGATWYDSNWNKARSIILDSADFASTLTDYVVYINVTSINLGTDTQADCDDIVFVKFQNNTRLSHEIETCDTTNNILEAWVKIPNAYSNGTEIFLYYDNSGATDQQSSQDVWSDYQMVHHLNGTLLDSTSNDNTCANTGTQAVSNDLLGDSRHWDGNNDYLRCGGDPSVDNIFNDGGTVSLWIEPTARPEGSNWIINKREAGLSGWGIKGENQANPMKIKFLAEDSTDWIWSTDEDVHVQDKWILIAVTWDSAIPDTDPLIYINGTSVPITEDSTGTSYGNDGGEAVCWGNIGGVNLTCLQTQTFEGDSDELRFGRTVLTADWLNSDYQCQRQDNNNDCITIGVEGSESAGGDSARSIADDFVMEESISRLAVYGRSLSDDYALEESISRDLSGDKARAIADDFVMEESISRLAVYGRSLSDDYALEETLTELMAFTRSLSDDYALEETLTELMAFTRSLSDDYALEESIARVSSGGEAIARAILDNFVMVEILTFVCPTCIIPTTGGGGAESDQTLLDKLEFNLLFIGDIPSVTAGETLQSFTIVAEWNTGNDLIINEVQIGETAVMLKFQDTPFTIKGSGGLNSEAVIPYTILIPSEYCDTDAIDDFTCVQEAIYDIPVTVSAEQDQIKYTTTTSVLVDVRPFGFNDGLMLFLIAGGIIFAGIILSKNKGNGNKKSGGKRSRLGTSKGAKHSKLSTDSTVRKHSKLSTDSTVRKHSKLSTEYSHNKAGSLKLNENPVKLRKKR